VAREEAAKKSRDPLLRESAAILGDAIGLLGADAGLSAQVLPQARGGTRWVD
jgi:carboxyl-terminal processing protease